MKTVFQKLGKALLPLVLVTAGTTANAYPVTFAFSGETARDSVIIPEGAVMYGSITYDSDTPLVEVGWNEYGYLIDSLVLNIDGETATHSGGSIRVFDSRISIFAGPYGYGGRNSFSNDILGAYISGFELELSGSSVPDILPDDPSVFYNMTGDFFINRSGGSVYDINSLANLAMPPTDQTTSVPEPGTLWLFGLGILSLLRRKIYPISALNLIPIR